MPKEVPKSQRLTPLIQSTSYLKRTKMCAINNWKCANSVSSSVPCPDVVRILIAFLIQIHTAIAIDTDYAYPATSLESILALQTSRRQRRRKITTLTRDPTITPLQKSTPPRVLLSSRTTNLNRQLVLKKIHVARR